MDYINKILCGNDLEILPQLPAESVSCITCSPPYWGLRDYGIEPVIWDGDKDCEHEFNEYDSKLLHENRQNLDGGTLGNPQYRKNLHGFGNAKAGFCAKCGAWRGSLGLEPTFELYIKHLCDIFDEIKRVLRKDGTCFINMGDSYWGGGQEGKFYMNKSLCDIPYRFSIEMINRGWIKRNTIIWHKPNCMPSSAPDRFTVDFEYLFFFTKNNKAIFWTNEKTLECVSKNPLGIKGIEGKDWEWQKKDSSWQRPSRDETFKLPSRQKSTYTKEGYKKVSLWTGHDYWFDQQFDDIAEATIKRAKYNWCSPRTKSFNHPSGLNRNEPYKNHINFSQGRNKRCVWIIPTQPFPEAHFAVYPEGLIEIPIKAGCPEFICKKCGKARVRMLETEQEINEWNEEYFYKLLLGNSHSNRHYKTALGIMRKWMVENNCYNYETFYNWYLTQKQGTWESGNLEVGQANKLSGMLPFPRPEKRLNIKTRGYTDCGCNAGWESGINLDPFMGTGTTALVALKQRKRFIGIEIKQEYIDMSYKRIANVQQNIF